MEVDNPLQKQFILSLMRFAKSSKDSRNFSCFGTMSFTEIKVFMAMTKIYERKGEKNDIQMSEISDMLGISKPALSQTVNKLEDKNLVERFNLKDDRRATYLRFTDNGLVIFEKNKQLLLDYIGEVIQQMGDEDAKEFIRLMDKYSSIVNDLNRKGRENFEATD